MQTVKRLIGCNGSSGNEATLDTVHTPSLSRPAEGIASLISLAADSLRHPDGHLYYIGASVFGILGYGTTVVAIGDSYPIHLTVPLSLLLETVIPHTLQYHCRCYWRQLSHTFTYIHYCSLIDSSEMVDTYGAALDEVRGFVLGGWEACGNHEGLSVTHTHTHTHTHTNSLPLPHR